MRHFFCFIDQPYVFVFSVCSTRYGAFLDNSVFKFYILDISTDFDFFIFDQPVGNARLLVSPKPSKIKPILSV